MFLWKNLGEKIKIFAPMNFSVGNFQLVALQFVWSMMPPPLCTGIHESVQVVSRCK